MSLKVKGVYLKITEEMASIITCLRSESRCFAEIFNQYLSLITLYTNNVKLMCVFICSL